MDRRSFLKTSAAIAAVPALPGLAGRAWAAAPGWRSFEVTTRVEILEPAGVTRIWLPTPLVVETPWQKPAGNQWSSDDGAVKFIEDRKWGVGMVSAEWAEGRKPVLTLVSRIATRDIAVDLKGPAGAPAESAEVLKQYLAPSDLLPTDGIVKDTASKIVADAGARTDLEKAGAIYEWVVDNTFRDPKTRGCGIGDIKAMLETGNLSGKCADLNALYVGLCRAAGVPARDVYGIRVADSALGYKSLGKSGDITRAQHCRAEFYAAGYGWVPADPADVRKVVLEEDGGKPVGDPKVVAARKRLFGSWEMNWMAYNFAHDLTLPGSTKSKIPFFMYPQSETARGRLDSLDPANFKYTITAKEIGA